MMWHLRQIGGAIAIHCECEFRSRTALGEVASDRVVGGRRLPQPAVEPVVIIIGPPDLQAPAGVLKMEALIP